jgi:hypothetical protein
MTFTSTKYTGTPWNLPFWGVPAFVYRETVRPWEGAGDRIACLCDLVVGFYQS